MAFADFSTKFIEISQGKALIRQVYANCIYTTMFIGYGLCKDVVIFPLCCASFAVPVRPYIRLRLAASFRLSVIRNAFAAY
jgi:hypothetical protein